MTGTICYMIYWSTVEMNRTKVVCYLAFLFLSGVQAAANFGLSLTKPDARQFIWNFLLCDYCKDFRAPPDGEKPHESDDETASSSVFHDPYLGLDEGVELTSRHMSVTAEPSRSRTKSMPAFRLSSLLSGMSLPFEEQHSRSKSITAFRTDSTGNIVGLSNHPASSFSSGEGNANDAGDVRDNTGIMINRNDTDSAV